MRIGCAIFLLCLFNLNVKAQQLHPACQVGAKWYYIYFKVNSGGGKVTTSLQTVTCIKDTFILAQPFSVLKADKGPGGFYEFSYLAKDDSSRLYFYAGTYFNQYKDTILLNFKFEAKSSSGLSQLNRYSTIKYHPDSKHTSLDSFFVDEVVVSKQYTNHDSVDTYMPLPIDSLRWMSNGSSIMHEKYLNTHYYDEEFPSPYFGIAEIDLTPYVTIDGGQMDLSCYTDSAETVRFIPKYLNYSCDYVTVPEIINESDLFALFPNPATDKIFLAYPQFEIPVKIEVLDVTGKVVLIQAADFASSNISIDLNETRPGVYFCKIYTEKSIFVKKFVVAAKG